MYNKIKGLSEEDSIAIDRLLLKGKKIPAIKLYIDTVGGHVGEVKVTIECRQNFLCDAGLAAMVDGKYYCEPTEKGKAWLTEHEEPVELCGTMSERQTTPNPKNFCGGNFQDWIEVMLTEKCNGSCSWCVDKNGFHPKEHVSWELLARKIIDTRKSNVILLGGEPTLYPHMKQLVETLVSAKRNVYITTNGSTLTKDYVNKTLHGITGINISIHDFYLPGNRKITGIFLDYTVLKKAVHALHIIGAVVRLNCNLIKGTIDSEKEIHRYIKFAKHLGVDSVRFAELKNDEKNFVDLNEIYDGKYGLNNEPFGLGCNQDATIDGMYVNFRQMCGLQMEGCKRKKPINPVQHAKQVLYYDGKIYDGWQLMKEEDDVDNDSKIIEILEKVEAGEMKTAQAALELGRLMVESKAIEHVAEHATIPGCAY